MTAYGRQICNLVDNFENMSEEGNDVILNISCQPGSDQSIETYSVIF